MLRIVEYVEFDCLGYKSVAPLQFQIEVEIGLEEVHDPCSVDGCAVRMIWDFRIDG